MPGTLGYLITWTTYGTWLQGDERGYVKGEKICCSNEALLQSNKRSMVQNPVFLSENQRKIIHQAIAKEPKRLEQKLFALSVQQNHIHIVAEYINRPIGRIVAYYKKAGRLALKAGGHSGRLWTAGYDKRFCFDRAALDQKIKYVLCHNK